MTDDKSFEKYMSMADDLDEDGSPSYAEAIRELLREVQQQRGIIESLRESLAIFESRRY